MNTFMAQVEINVDIIMLGLVMVPVLFHLGFGDAAMCEHKQNSNKLQ
jgi:hypothetical protein